MSALRVERFHEPLTTQRVVPCLRVRLMLRVKLRIVSVVILGNEARPVLHAAIVVAVVLCEAPDYVERSLIRWLRRSVHAALVFALLNIVRESSRTDIRSARGDYGPVIEEGATARGVCSQV